MKFKSLFFLFFISCSQFATESDPIKFLKNKGVKASLDKNYSTPDSSLVSIEPPGNSSPIVGKSILAIMTKKEGPTPFDITYVDKGSMTKIGKPSPLPEELSFVLRNTSEGLIPVVEKETGLEKRSYFARSRN